MTEDIDNQSGCVFLGTLSVAASALGSALGSVVYCALHTEPGGWETVGQFLLGSGMVFLFGVAIAIPVGLLLGIPMLAGSRWLLSRYTVVTTLAFALVGLLGGLAVQYLGGRAGLDNAELIFGACVGGMHPLVYSRAKGTAWALLSFAFLVSAVFVPAVVYAGEDVKNLIESREEFEERCADRYGSMAFVADRAALERWKSPVRTQGKWLNQRKWRSLYALEERYPLDAARVLIARDYAYVPGGFAGWITGGRRVEQHCLSQKTGSSVHVLREHGFGKRPSLGDLVD